jgi:hypothetical protein
MGEEKVLLPYQQRVVEEQGALDVKISFLNTFLEGEQFLTLPEIDQNLLIKQVNLMEEYSYILGERIKRF